jgi:hypothetical protein
MYTCGCNGTALDNTNCLGVNVHSDCRCCYVIVGLWVLLYGGRKDGRKEGRLSWLGNSLNFLTVSLQMYRAS